MARSGAVGPAMTALVEYLTEHRGTSLQIAQAIGFGHHGVQKNIERLRAKGSPLVKNVLKDYGRPAAMRARQAPPPSGQTIVIAAMRARTVLEVCWKPGRNDGS